MLLLSAIRRVKIIITVVFTVAAVADPEFSAFEFLPHLCLQAFDAPYTTGFAMDSFAAAKAALDATSNE